jgi:DNA segregation ATPase FtsK/SpoIIIE, S-DNA-T family
LPSLSFFCYAQGEMSDPTPAPKTPTLPQRAKSFLTPDLDQDSKVTLAIIGCFAITVVLVFSLMGMGGSLGSAMAQLFRGLLGWGSYLVPFGFLLSGFALVNLQKNRELAQDLSNRLAWGFVFMLISFVAFLNIFTHPANFQDAVDHGGGAIGFLLYPMVLGNTVGVLASVVLLSTLFLFGFFLVTNFTFVQFAVKLGQSLRDPGRFMDFIPDIFEVWNKKPVTQQQKVKEDLVGEAATPDVKTEANRATHFVKKDEPVPDSANDAVQATFAPVKPAKPKQRFRFEKSDSGVIEFKKSAETDPLKQNIWGLPPFSILEQTTMRGDPGDIDANKKTIQDTLRHFGIEVEMGDVIIGPTVSQYPFKPQNGVKLSAIDNLQRDLALALAVPNIRIQPIPKTTLVGIAVPNRAMAQVRMRDLLQTNDFIHSDRLTVAIGQDVAGKNMLFAIADMPHLLVAGATGSGKSVWINGMLISLLFKYAPHQLGLILVDMKRVELKLYDGIPHLLTSVITEADKAINALKWAVLEMDKRYQLLESQGKRNIVDYNIFAEKDDNVPKLSYIVFVIDELADLMIMAKSEVEPLIARLTQMARAVGIHVILGTQRPDTSVITGLIKTNVPTRIAFAVPSEIDSRVILGSQGAEKLLGKGDGLMLSPRVIAPVRFQGAYLDESEVKECVDFLKTQVNEQKVISNIRTEITEPPKQKIKIPGLNELDSGGDEEDEVYEGAKRMVVQYQKASASFLQQMMGIGYPKAAKIIMRLEENGVIGPQNGAKPRDVYEIQD